MNFYKILNEEETHNGLKYHDGLNEDPLEFNPSGDCESGGIYFVREDILAFLNPDSVWIRKVTIPEGEPVYENPGDPKKWKAKRVILGPRRKINLQIIKELVEEGVDIHENKEYVLTWAAVRGYLDVVKWATEKGASVHAYNDEAIRCAAREGHLNIVKFLAEKGANIHTFHDEAMRLAAANGHLNVVKYLVEKGANIHAEDDRAVIWAAERGHLDVVKYLISKGANIHING